MGFRLKKNDLNLFATLADCRVLTTTQIAALHFDSKKKSARRRLHQLAEAGFIADRKRDIGQIRGRSENVYFVGEDGFALLKDRKILPSSTTREQVSAENIWCVEHELLLNWFRIHLRDIQNCFPNLTADFFSSESAFAPTDEYGRPLLHVRISTEEVEDGADDIRFKPDGAFRITDTDRKSSLLFFLEVDMGTEPLVRRGQGGRDICTKIVNYQALIASERYKILERVWRCEFSGFRLLFLTNTVERMSALCRLAQAMSPSNFIWATDQERMFDRGLGSDIWARGCDMAKPPESILGKTLSRATPLPVLLP